MRIGTRRSKLALKQSELFSERVGGRNTLIGISSAGDIDKSSSLEEIGGSGLFVDVLNKEVLKGNVDCAVHSAKDLPTRIDGDLEIACVFEWKNYHDVMLCRNNTPFNGKGIVGTSSPRRREQIMRAYPDATIKNIRGNVDTRIRKMNEGEYDCLIMSEAGLIRLYPDIRMQILPAEQFVPSANQGIIAVVTRRDSKYLKELKSLSDPVASRRMEMERAASMELNVGCSEPTGIFFDPQSNILYLDISNGRKHVSVKASARNIADVKIIALGAKQKMQR